MSFKKFTPEAHKTVDLKRLLLDIRYPLDISGNYGMDVLSDLLNEAKSIQEAEIRKEKNISSAAIE